MAGDYLSKPFAIQQGPDAEHIDYNFDTLWRLVRSLQDQITDLSDVDPSHKILSTTHSDSVVATPADGDMLMYNTAAGGWERLPIGTSLQFLVTVASVPTWTSFSISFVPAHNLLSAQHGDTTIGSPVRGDVIVAQSDTTGGVDSSKYWLDGRRLPATSSEYDPGTMKYWFDGDRMPELVSAQTTGVTTWRRKSRGSTGQVLGLAANGLDSDWVTPSALTNSGTGAKAYATVDQTIPFNSDTLIVLAATEFDSSSLWAAGTPSRLTVPQTGVYIVCGQVSPQAGAFANTSQPMIYVNGVVRAKSNHGLHNVEVSYYTHDPAQCVAILSLAAGDYVELYYRHINLGRAAINNLSGAALTFLSVVKA